MEITKLSEKIRKQELEKFNKKTKISALKQKEKNEKENTWKTIKFTLLIDFKAQPRARFRRFSKFVSAYDPLKNWKILLGKRIKKILNKKSNDFPVLGAVIIECNFYRSIPVNYSLKKKYLCELGVIKPEKIPDGDNYIKALKDALKGIAWKDDGQVTFGSYEKFYSNTPRIDVKITYKLLKED